MIQNTVQRGKKVYEGEVSRQKHVGRNNNMQQSPEEYTNTGENEHFKRGNG